MRLAPVSILCIVPTILSAGGEPFRELANHDEALAIFENLLHHGGYGLRQTESAAFILQDETGSYRCLEWPYTGKLMRQTYRGVLPPSTVAIAHTHPKSSRQPSTVDIETARSLGLPVFVLTPLDIWVATPGGEAEALVEDREWSAKALRGGGPKAAAERGASRSVLAQVRSWFRGAGTLSPCGAPG